MKRIICLALISALVFSGCGGMTSESAWSTDANGNRVYTMQGSTTVYADTLPVQQTYNDTYITLEKVDVYQTCPNYSYSLYLVATFDISNLDDNQIHWLRESDMRVSSYLTSENNGQDFDSMSILGSLLVSDEEKLYFVFTSSFWDENRYDFAGSEISLYVTLAQEETYTVQSNKKDVEMNCETEVMHTFTLPDKITDAELIPEPLYGYIVKWLNELM